MTTPPKVKDGRARTSAVNGRLSKGCPRGVQGPRMKTRERAAAIQRHAELTADTVIEQIARGALYDIGALFDEDGSVKPLHALTEEERSCIAGFEIVLKNAAAGDGVIDRVLKVKLADRAKYVEMAAKYHTLFVDKIEVSTTIQGMSDDALRERAAVLLASTKGT